MLFIGVDLAWSEKNATGLSVMDENAKVLDARTAMSDEEIINYVTKHATEEAFVAIDAPLIVPNESGRRIAEVEVGNLFRKYDAGAHPANRTRLGQWSEGRIRGEELSRKLEAAGFEHDPYIKQKEISSKFFEVYPHTSMVVLFEMDRILRYKAKPKRDYAFRYSEFTRYLNYMNRLVQLPRDIAEIDITQLKAQRLKDFEDRMDAIFCAYIAYYTWKNPDKTAVLGDMQGGYILTPIFEHMKKIIAANQSTLINW